MEDNREDTDDRSWITKRRVEKKKDWGKSQPIEIVYARVEGYKRGSNAIQ